MSKYIAIEIEDDGVKVHAVSTCSGYATLCGLDGGISDGSQREVGLLIGSRIDCPQCLQIWEVAKGLRKRDFCKSILPDAHS